MAVKPGDTRRSATGGTLIWTGRAWVPMPRLRAEQTALRKKISEAQGRGNFWDNPLGINRPTTGDAERSWKSRGATSGTVSSATASRGRGTGYGASTITSQSKMPATKKPAPKNPKPKESAPKSSAAAPSRSSAGAASSRNPSQAGGGRKPSVSQSKTMWVAKGTMVNGETVKKGYLAQYGKPEKRVTANVRAVKGNAAGMKAGSVTQYKGGRKVKKGK
jgi:hypothetical protein